MIRAVIIDDEPLARQRIKTLLESYDTVELVGEAANGPDGVLAIKRHKPDLVFLDVQMPEFDGFEVVAKIGAANMPEVIFVTAYDQYALKAFSVHALDYLLKPFDPDRFEDAVARALERVRTKPTSDRTKLNKLLKTVQKDGRAHGRILVRDGGHTTIVKVETIDWIESAGNYVKLHVGRTEHMLRDTMKNLLWRLDNSLFVRIHRTAIVNVDRIKELHPYFHGDHVIMLENGTRLPLSRRYRKALQEALDRR